MPTRTLSLWEDQRSTLADAIEQTAQALIAHGAHYRHWTLAYSGGKDSTALVTTVCELIATGRVPAPQTLIVYYCDTRMELPPLHLTALAMLASLAKRGVEVQVVLPPLDDRFFVYVCGLGVPPPSNRFRWCTSRMKVEPMKAHLEARAVAFGLGEMVPHPRTGKPHYVPLGDEKLLMLTGVRLGESAVRDQRISVSCSRDGAECGQGWFQNQGNGPVADTLAPLLSWRVCHIWDWLTFDAPRLGYPTAAVAESYGGEEAAEKHARTGCVGCNLASRDVALDYVLTLPHWSHLAPLKHLRPLYAELKLSKYRLRKDGSEKKKDGSLVKNPQRKGPLTFGARRYALARVLEIQREINDAADARGLPGMTLINDEELARIEELIAAGAWPDRWDGSEPLATVPLDQVKAEGITQPLLDALRSL